MRRTDRLVALRFIGDDANVCEVTVRKFWGDEPGIRVTITPADPPRVEASSEATRPTPWAPHHQGPVAAALF